MSRLSRQSSIVLSTRYGARTFLHCYTGKSPRVDAWEVEGEDLHQYWFSSRWQASSHGSKQAHIRDAHINSELQLQPYVNKPFTQLQRFSHKIILPLDMGRDKGKWRHRCRELFQIQKVWGICGAGKARLSWLPPAKPAFDYVDEKDCKQDNHSLLINSLQSSLQKKKIFNYTVWKAAVTRSALSAPLAFRCTLPPDRNILLFSLLHTPKMGLH